MGAMSEFSSSAVGAPGPCQSRAGVVARSTAAAQLSILRRSLDHLAGVGQVQATLRAHNVVNVDVQPAVFASDGLVSSPIHVSPTRFPPASTLWLASSLLAVVAVMGSWRVGAGSGASLSLVQGLAIVSAVAAVSSIVWFVVLGSLVHDVSQRMAIPAVAFTESGLLMRLSSLVYLSGMCAGQLAFAQFGDIGAMAYLWCLGSAYALVVVVSTRWDVFQSQNCATIVAAERFKQRVLFRFAAQQCSGVGFVLCAASFGIQLYALAQGVEHISSALPKYPVYSFVLPTIIVLEATSLVARIDAFSCLTNVPSVFSDAVKSLGIAGLLLRLCR